MASDNNKDKKGFSGLSDLASEVSDINEPIKPEPKAAAKPSTLKQPPQPQRETTPSEPERKTTSSPQSVETVNSGKSSGGSDGKWILGIIGIIFVIWLINNAGQSNKKPPYTPPSSSQNYSYPQSTSAPAVQTPSTTQSAGLQYTKPSVGTNNVLSVPEIRWCIREGIRIEAMRDVIDNNAGIDEFNRIVNNYNSRCGSYRYRQGSQSRAERDVEAYRSQIVSEAIREAGQLGRSYQPSYPSVSPGVSASTAPKKPNAQYTREAQQILTDLGYDPGPVDDDYGRRTADAVKAFQYAAGITQDGWIDENLLSTLRRAKAGYEPPVVSQPEPQSQASIQPRPSTPSTTTTTAAGYFTRGSHQDEVLRIQGRPDDINDYSVLGYEENIQKTSQSIQSKPFPQQAPHDLSPIQPDHATLTSSASDSIGYDASSLSIEIPKLYEKERFENETPLTIIDTISTSDRSASSPKSDPFPIDINDKLLNDLILLDSPGQEPLKQSVAPSVATNDRLTDKYRITRSDVAATDPWSGLCIGIIDGDTITVLRGREQVRIRLYGIDCPESGQDYGTVARYFTGDMVHRKDVTITSVEIDRYGRTVGYIDVDGVSLNRALIENGLAWVYDQYCATPECEEWRMLQAEARENRRGLWELPNPVPPWEWQQGDPAVSPPSSQPVAASFHHPTLPNRQQKFADLSVPDSDENEKSDDSALSLPPPPNMEAPSDFESSPLSLDVKSIPERQRRKPLSIDTLDYDDLTPEAKKLFKGNAPLARRVLRMAPDERKEYLLRTVTNKMEAADELRLTPPEMEQDIVRAAVMTGMSEDEARYWYGKDRKYIENRIAHNQVVNNSGFTGYYTKIMQQVDGSDKIRREAKALSELEALYLGNSGTTADRILYDIRKGIGSVGIFGTKMVGGTVQGISDSFRYGPERLYAIVSGAPQSEESVMNGRFAGYAENAVNWWWKAREYTETNWTGPTIDTGNPVTDFVRTAVFQGAPFYAGAIGLSLLAGPQAALTAIGLGVGADIYQSLRQSPPGTVRASHDEEQEPPISP